VPASSFTRNELLARAKTHYQSKDYHSALADFTAVLKLDPTHVEAHHLRAHCHAFLGKLDGALADVSKAIEYKPGDAHFHDMRGGYHMRRREYAEAVPDLLRVLELGKEDTPARRDLAWIYLVGPEELRDAKQGLAMAERAVAQQETAETLIFLGQAHLRL